MVVVGPNVFHQGFNMGASAAESVNFALDDWLDQPRPDWCSCGIFGNSNLRISAAAWKRLQQQQHGRPTHAKKRPSKRKAPASAPSPPPA